MNHSGIAAYIRYGCNNIMIFSFVMGLQYRMVCSQCTAFLEG